jgi:hypothetical protein
MGSELRALVVGSGFEPLKAKPADLQSAPIGHSGNPPMLFGASARLPQRAFIWEIHKSKLGFSLKRGSNHQL